MQDKSRPKTGKILNMIKIRPVYRGYAMWANIIRLAILATVSLW